MSISLPSSHCVPAAPIEPVVSCVSVCAATLDDILELMSLYQKELGEGLKETEVQLGRANRKGALFAQPNSQHEEVEVRMHQGGICSSCVCVCVCFLYWKVCAVSARTCMYWDVFASLHSPSLLCPALLPRPTPTHPPLRHPSCLMHWWQWRPILERHWTLSLKQCGEGY